MRYKSMSIFDNASVVNASLTKNASYAQKAPTVSILALLAAKNAQQAPFDMEITQWPQNLAIGDLIIQLIDFSLAHCHQPD